MALGGATSTAMLATLYDGWPSGGTDSADIFGGPYNDPTFLLSSIWYQNVWCWSIFAAYRDARLFNERHGYRYRYPTPKEELSDVLLAPFSPEVMLKPEVGAGLFVWLAAGLALSYAVEGSLTSPRGNVFSRKRINFMGRRMQPAAGMALGEAYYVGLFTPVGIGEEALFRGYLQTNMTDAWGPTVGRVVSSIFFGLAHAGNALFIEDPQAQKEYLVYALPYLTLSGAFLGWVYQHNNFSLNEVPAPP